jgi:hypothetical protein
MSDPSAVEYWEKYALHAFDNTDSAVYSSCILMSPTKRVVPCTFCFTIKRDIFDLPSVIVGNVRRGFYVKISLDILIFFFIYSSYRFSAKNWISHASSFLSHQQHHLYAFFTVTPYYRNSLLSKIHTHY